MRVIAGKLRHRTIDMTNLDTTRETQDKVRGAIFNMIGPYFDGGKVLDLFAGSGAMGIEAYSRGVEEIYLNDIEPKAIEICKKNCKNLGIEACHFSCLDYQIWLKQNKIKFDLIFLDPPYRLSQIEAILEAVSEHLVVGGKIIFEMAKESDYPNQIVDLQLKKDKCYGIKRVVVYEKEHEVVIA